QPGGEDAIECGGSTAALEVSDDGDAAIPDITALFDRFGDLVGVARFVALGDHDHRRGFAAGTSFGQPGGEYVEIGGSFGDEYFLRAAGNAGHHGDVSVVAAHDLDEENAVVRIRGVAEAID